MPSTVFDSDIFKDMFGTPEMRAVFSDDNLLKCYIDAEVALALAQGRTGVIPQDAADAIAKTAPSVVLDRAALKHEAENVGYPILGLVRQLSAKLGDAGRYVHWGATTQDIMIPARCCRFAPRWRSSSAIWQRYRPRWRRLRQNTAILRWPGARTCNRRCRLPLATNAPSGFR